MKLVYLIGLVLAKTHSTRQDCLAAADQTQADGDNQCRQLVQNNPPVLNKCLQGVQMAADKIRDTCNQTNPTKKRKRSTAVNLSDHELHRINNNWTKRDQCWWSNVYNMNICLNVNDMIELGQKASETCNWDNNGQQKCVNDKGFITCVNNQWTVEQYCGSGTKCQPYPTDPNNHVLCGY
ncbi:hypothetical protein HDV01_001913 [Terramyces sp. JEL0728]|nr:hypothetical protein HDV01_001913 [Terramyces sp. JEL0728]